MAAWKTLPGSGALQWLENYYKSDNTVTRLAGRGGSLYQSTGGAFALATGGAVFHATNIWSGAMLRDKFYISDRSGALRAYDNTNGVTAVVQPTVPSGAPLVKRRVWGILERWAGAVGARPTGWSADVSGDFDVAVADNATTGADPDFPMVENAAGTPATAKFTMSTAKKNINVFNSDVTTTRDLQSRNIAFFGQQSNKRQILALEIGAAGYGDLGSAPIDPPEDDQVFPFFMDVGLSSQIKYLRFRKTRVPDAAQKLFVTRLYLPGKLFGKYRWRYTHVIPSTGAESIPSATTEFQDFSAPQVNYQSTDVAAFQKSASILAAHDADATTTQIRLYRNGGDAPALFKDSYNQDVWIPVATIIDLATTLNGGVSAAAASVVLTTATAGTGANQKFLAAGDWLVFEAGTVREEFVQVASSYAGAGATTVPLATPFLFAHANATAAQSAYVDNVGNETITTSLDRLQIERDDPPAGAQWVASSPDERLWLFGYAGFPLGVAVSNRRTLIRPFDHEVFPNNVDPATRGDLLQGWRFSVGGEAGGDAIRWGGFFHGIPTILTTKGLYQVHAYSQAEWGPTSVAKVLEVGCIAGETVQEVNGLLYWVGPGPVVYRWDGQSAPEEVSYLRVSATLRAAPSAYWSQWFARAHSDENGAWYKLWITPSGATTNSQLLEYNTTADSWERHTYYDSGGTALPWAYALAWRGPGDLRELYAGHPTSGAISQLETGLTDAGNPIRIRLVTKKFPLAGTLDVVGAVHEVNLLMAGVADTVTLRCRTSDSEYRNATAFPATDGDPATDSVLALPSTGTADAEIKKRMDWGKLKGRVVSFQITGSVVNRPAFRDIEWKAQGIRVGRQSAGV